MKVNLSSQGTIFKKILFALLQLDNELIATLVLAAQVKNRLPVKRVAAKLLGLQTGQNQDFTLLFFEQLVEKIQQQILVRLLPENLLKAVIGEQQVDVSGICSSAA
jgi:hypothetical protein